MTPKISCIIPTKNREEFLWRAVASVFSTGYDNIEIIIVDDASYNLIALPIWLKIKSNYIKIIRLNYSLGGAGARNAGIDAATGDYISFLDDDDELLVDKYKIMEPLLSNYDFDAVVAECRIINVKDGGCIDCSNSNFSKINNTIRNRVHTNATLIKRNVFDKIRFNASLSKFQDTQFNTDLCYHFKVKHIDNIVANWYVCHGNGQITSHVSRWNNFFNGVKLLRHFIFESKIPVFLLWRHFLVVIWYGFRAK